MRLVGGGGIIRLVWLMALTVAALARAQTPGVSARGALLEERAGTGPSLTHAWVVVPAGGGERGAEVLHLPPRGVMSERDGRVVGAHPGEARPAYAVADTPLAVAARDNHLAMVFTDPSGFPQTHGRTVLALSTTSTNPGVWETEPKGRLDSLPSLRADGLVLGFEGAEAGYCVLYQGLTLENADSSRLVLQLLSGSSWVDLPVPAELEVVAAQWFSFAAGSKPTTKAAWQLFATPGGVAVLVMPPGGAPDRALGTIYSAAITPAAGKEKPTARWTASDVRLPRDVLVDHVTALAAAGHYVIAGLTGGNTAAHQGVLHIFTRPCDFAAEPWREVASVAGVSTDHGVAALEGVGRIAVVSAPVTAEDRREREKMTMTEISIGTGAVVYSGPLLLASPISKSDYRMVAVILAYALGLVMIFLLRTPPADAILLPEGYSLAEPGRRMVAGVIDIAVALVAASRLLHMPFGDLLSPAAWWSEQGQSVLLVSVGVMIGMNTVLELLFARSVGKIIVGCQVALVATVGAGEKPANATAPAEGGPASIPRHPGLGALLLRNIIKFALPPVALLGLLDASGRHRADQLARTAVIVEGVDEEEDEGGEEE